MNNKKKSPDMHSRGSEEQAEKSFPQFLIKTALEPERIMQRIQGDGRSLSFRELVQQIEIAVVEAALAHNNYNEFQTAKYLKMDRNTLRRIRTRARRYAKENNDQL